MINKITIIGVGLIGGSLAKAIKENKLAKVVFGFGRDLNRLEKAQKAKSQERVAGIRSPANWMEGQMKAAKIQEYSQLWMRYWPRRHLRKLRLKGSLLRNC